jgi:hypothetical protein
MISATLVPGAVQHVARSAKWCAADPGPFHVRSLERSRTSGAPLRKSFALRRIRDKRGITK